MSPTPLIPRATPVTVTRPPNGPTAVAIVSSSAPYGLQLILAGVPKLGGANRPVASTNTFIGLDRGAYPPESAPGSPVTAAKCSLIAATNCNGSFNDPNQGLSIDVLFFTHDGTTPLNCVSPVDDPGGVNTNRFNLDYSVNFAANAALNPGRAYCPLLTATTKKLSVNMTLAAQLGTDGGYPFKYVFLPSATFGLGLGFVVQWQISVTDASGRVTINNYKQIYNWL